MAKILRQRMTAEMEGDFVVFLIGMRINTLWKIHRWLPVALAMPRMIRELEQNPQLGFLGAQQGFGNPVIMVQYWRSFEQLEAYARNPNNTHLPAWAAFNRRVARGGDVGIWHETYLIRAGEYETIYHNMPAFGLGRVTKLVPIVNASDSAAARAGRVR
jgi:hypothetical protein